MKEKYLILKSDEKDRLTIRKFVESDPKDGFSFVCEETYGSEIIKSAISKDVKVLMSKLRTKYMHPPRLYAEEIAESVVKLYGSKSDQPIEILFDDKDYFFARLVP